MPKSGETAIRVSLSFATIVAAIVLLAGTRESAHGQGVGAYYDLNTPLSGEHWSENHRPFVAESRASFGCSVDYHLQVERGMPRASMKLAVRRQAARLHYDEAEPPFSSDYSLWSFLFGFDAYLVRHRRFGLALGASTGLAYAPDNSPSQCNEALCRLPKVELLISPELRCIIPLSRMLAVAGGIRRDIHLGDADVTFPFESGVQYSVGIQLFASGWGEH